MMPSSNPSSSPSVNPSGPSSVYPSSMPSESHEEGRIPRKKQKKKVPEPLVTVNKVTQDPDDKNEDDNIGSIIEGTKTT